MHAINLFEDGGWLNIPYILSYYKTTFIAIIGGRGIGKTYGAVKYWWTHNLQALFLRRTQTQLETLMIKELSPFYDYSVDSGTPFELTPVGKNLYQLEVGENKQGFAGALSTFKNLRGFSGKTLDLEIYDEFIPEPHEPKIKKGGFCLL